MTWTLYHNPKCSKSREALEYLSKLNMDLHVVEYLKTPLSEKDLLALASELEGPLAALVRTKEEDYIASPFDTSSKEEVARHLANTPRLMERPILRGNGKAVIGRPLQNFEKLISR